MQHRCTIQLVSGQLRHEDTVKRLVASGYQSREFIYVNLAKIPSDRNEVRKEESFPLEAEQYISEMKQAANIDESDISLNDFLRWFQDKTGKPFNFSALQTEGIISTPYLLKLNNHISMLDKSYTIETIAYQLNHNKKVMVVYHSQAFSYQLPVLEDMLGKATYLE